MTDHETARRLDYSVQTIKGYLQSARQKLYAHDTTHATWVAFFCGYLTPDDVHKALYADS